MTTSPLRRAMAELIGTYALVTAGCGAIIVNTTTGALSHVGVALTFGLIIMHISPEQAHRLLPVGRGRCCSTQRPYAAER
jgi:aquaporin NIP